MNTNPPLRQGRAQRNGASSPAKRRISLAALLGWAMPVLMLSYVVIVLNVAIAKWPMTVPTSEVYDLSASRNALLDKRWAAIKKERGLIDLTVEKVEVLKADKSSEIKRKNPFRNKHLNDPLTHGVKPETLLHSDEKVTAAKENIPIHKRPTPENVLTAYTEHVNYDDWDVKPLPLRNTTAKKLQELKYPRLQSCSKLPQQWPVDDSPVDADSYLPWIHDVFPTADGKYIQFVAQNKRRCKNGSKEKDILHQQQPQAALFQHVSLKRTKGHGSAGTRYRLATHNDADEDALATRFICRFKPDMTETLSEYNFDYDWTAYRKRYKASFSEDDAGIKAIHTSQLIFRCPVPEHMQSKIATGETVENDWASLFVDLIPVRTPPRFGLPHRYFIPQYKEFETVDPAEKFDAEAAWGENHVLPLIEDSGRWENIPICKPSLMTYEGQEADEIVVKEDVAQHVVIEPIEPLQKHRLVSCVWASAGYNTRGNRFAINDGQRRLLEWIEYNKLTGFDHVYVYDNSGAFGNDTSLKPIADLFPDHVTYIPWPSQICNNNPNNVDSVGERSSQYAAESSCRLRFGPHVDWIGQFDIDEYLIPMGNHTTITSLLDALEKEDTRIISFASWRALPRRAFIQEPVKIEDRDTCWHNEPCFDLKIPTAHTMLQSYNCDQQKPGHKTDSMPAEKQLYRPDYVLQHFVHYSAATVQSERNRTESVKYGLKWKRQAFPDPRQRFADEVGEALMIHTKAVAIQDTAGWERMCHINNTRLPKRRQGTCRLGVPYPEEENNTDRIPRNDTAAASSLSSSMELSSATVEGWMYNCYVNPRVETYLAPKLTDAMARHSPFFEGSSS